jgi:predicted transcriptional regulator
MLLWLMRTGRIRNGYLMKSKITKVGIISRDAYRRRTIAIARGEYRPKKDEPKVWVESNDKLTQALRRHDEKDT